MVSLFASCFLSISNTYKRVLRRFSLVPRPLLPSSSFQPPPRVLSVSLSFHILVVAHTWRVCVSNYLPPFPFVARRFSFEGHVRFHKRVGVALNPPANRTRISAFLLLYPIFASFSCFHVRTWNSSSILAFLRACTLFNLRAVFLYSVGCTGISILFRLFCSLLCLSLF